jgi:hypothetical protein
VTDDRYTHGRRPQTLVGVWTVRVSVDGQAPDLDRFTLLPPQ